MNSNLVKFIVKNNLEENTVEPKKESRYFSKENKLSAYTKFAAVPVHVNK